MDFMGILVVFGDGISKPIQDTIRKAVRRPVQAFSLPWIGKGSLDGLRPLQNAPERLLHHFTEDGFDDLGVHGVVQELNGGALGHKWL
jgi:hypothetical protein